MMRWREYLEAFLRGVAEGFVQEAWLLLLVMRLLALAVALEILKLFFA